MTKLAPLVLIFSLFLMLPDTPVMAEMSVEKVAKKVKFSIDKSDGILDLKGPKIKGLRHDPYYIRTFADREIVQATVHFLIVEYDFIKANPGHGYLRTVESAYKKFYTAVDGEENSFELETFYRDFDGCNDSVCSFDEYFRIKIPHQYFQQHSASGIRLRARSQAGTYIELYLYPSYVQGMLLRLDQERAKLTP